MARILRWLALFALTILAIVLAVLLLKPDAGYVLISYGRFSLETSIWVFALGITLLYFVIRSVAWTWRQFAGFTLRRREKAELQLHEGLRHLAAGDFARAAKELAHSARHGQAPLIHHLAATVAAHLGNDAAMADQSLQAALKVAAENDTSALFLSAQIAAERSRWAEVLTAVRRIRELHPQHGPALRLQVRALEANQQWNALRELLPSLQQHQVLATAEYQALEGRLFTHLLASETRDATRVSRLLAEMPKYLRQNAEVVRAGAEALVEAHHGVAAEELIRNYLANQWHEDLCRLYGLVPGDLSAQEKNAQQWLKAQGSSPALRLTLARLLLRRGDWTAAEALLKQSIELGQESAAQAYAAEAVAELVRLQQALGQGDAAVDTLTELLRTIELIELPSLPNQSA